PATSDAGTSESNPLALQNAGLATASALIIADSLPGGGSGTVTGAPATLAAGANGSAQAVYPIPASQPEGGLTDTAGITWQGANGGTDVAQATFTSGSFSLQSNTSTITWITPVATVGTTPVQGNFYAEASSACSFVAQPGNTPAFGQSFPSIEFNPPAGIVPH